MSTPLVTALRESCGYLRDGGYAQTAQLMMLAADEIERLERAVRALEAQKGRAATPRRSTRPAPSGRLRGAALNVAQPDPARTR